MNPSLYIHIPFCTSKCDYCDFFSVLTSYRTVGNLIPDEYIDALANEIKFYTSKYSIKNWKTVYVGGGTPSLLTSSQILTLFNCIFSDAGKDSSAEITFEMNPQSCTEEKLLALESSGVNRLSLGIQSLNNNALKAINRRCSSQTALSALELVKQKWKGLLSLDAIAGLPEQNMDEFEKSLEQIISFEPDHISLYSLMVEEGTPLFHRIDTGLLDYDYDECDEQWLYGRTLLEKSGYYQYEVSNFARKGFEAVHNMAYWQQKDYIGVGSGACGTIYGENSGERWTNSDSIKKYMSFWNGQTDFSDTDLPRTIEILDKDTMEYEFLMMGLRTRKGINSAVFEKKYGKTLELRLGKPWEKFSNLGYTEKRFLEDGSFDFTLNSKGILFLNSLLAEI